MENFIDFLKLFWFRILCTGLGVLVFLTLPLDEYNLLWKIIAFILCVVVMPAIGQSVYDEASEKLLAPLRPVRFGCIAFIIGLILWNNIPFTGVSWWVKLLLGVIVFAVFPLFVQMMFGEDGKNKN